MVRFRRVVLIADVCGRVARRSDHARHRYAVDAAVHTMAENLIYSAQGSDVVLTMVDGTILYENGEYPTIDIEKEIAETCAARERILSEMA